MLNSFSALPFLIPPPRLTSLAHKPLLHLLTMQGKKKYIYIYKRTLGHFVAQKLASLRFKEMENGLRAKTALWF